MGGGLSHVGHRPLLAVGPHRPHAGRFGRSRSATSAQPARRATETHGQRGAPKDGIWPAHHLRPGAEGRVDVQPGSRTEQDHGGPVDSNQPAGGARTRSTNRRTKRRSARRYLVCGRRRTRGVHRRPGTVRRGHRRTPRRPSRTRPPGATVHVRGADSLTRHVAAPRRPASGGGGDGR